MFSQLLTSVFAFETYHFIEDVATVVVACTEVHHFAKHSALKLPVVARALKTTFYKRTVYKVDLHSSAFIEATLSPAEKLALETLAAE